MSDNHNNNNPNAEAALQQPPVSGTPPKCPYCGKAPAMINSSSIQMGNLPGVVFSCGYEDCRKIFNIQVLGVIQPEAPRITAPPPGFKPKLT